MRRSANRSGEELVSTHRGRLRAHAGATSGFVALVGLVGWVAIAQADVTFPRDFGKPPIADLKNQIKDAKNGPKAEQDEAKKRAKNAVDDALDGGLGEDAQLDAGKSDAGDAGDDVTTEEGERREREKTRSERAARSRQELRRLLAEKGAGKSMDDDLRDELRLHAKRVAFLDRIGSLAYRAKDDDSLRRVKKLLELELGRHEARLKIWGSEGSRP